MPKTTAIGIINLETPAAVMEYQREPSARVVPLSAEVMEQNGIPSKSYKLFSNRRCAGEFPGLSLNFHFSLHNYPAELKTAWADIAGFTPIGRTFSRFPATKNCVSPYPGLTQFCYAVYISIT